MRKQHAVWSREYAIRASIPAMNSDQPSSGVMQFIEYLKQHSQPISGRAVDIGAGKGRHSVYLAELGYYVYALEYVESALAAAQQLAYKHQVLSRTSFQLAEIDQPWQYDDDFFTIAIDSFASIDIETIRGREICRDEMYRTLKPGGLALVLVVSADDFWEQKLIREHPAAEKNSTIWPISGKFQKDYDELELRSFYAKFEVLELKKIQKPTRKLGIKGQATNFWLVLKKPLSK